jgi:hypothetical protein
MNWIDRLKRLFKPKYPLDFDALRLKWHKDICAQAETLMTRHDELVGHLMDSGDDVGLEKARRLYVEVDHLFDLITRRFVMNGLQHGDEDTPRDDDSNSR